MYVSVWLNLDPEGHLFLIVQDDVFNTILNISHNRINLVYNENLKK